MQDNLIDIDVQEKLDLISSYGEMVVEQSIKTFQTIIKQLPVKIPSEHINNITKSFQDSWYSLNNPEEQYNIMKDLIFNFFQMIDELIFSDDEIRELQELTNNFIKTSFNDKIAFNSVLEKLLNLTNKAQNDNFKYIVFLYLIKESKNLDENVKIFLLTQIIEVVNQINSLYIQSYVLEVITNELREFQKDKILPLIEKIVIVIENSESPIRLFETIIPGVVLLPTDIAIIFTQQILIGVKRIYDGAYKFDVLKNFMTVINNLSINKFKYFVQQIIKIMEEINYHSDWKSILKIITGSVINSSNIKINFLFSKVLDKISLLDDPETANIIVKEMIKADPEQILSLLLFRKQESFKDNPPKVKGILSNRTIKFIWKVLKDKKWEKDKRYLGQIFSTVASSLILQHKKESNEIYTEIIEKLCLCKLEDLDTFEKIEEHFNTLCDVTESLGNTNDPSFSLPILKKLLKDLPEFYKISCRSVKDLFKNY